MRVLISAGEASGENYGALLLPELRRILGNDTEFFGVGGERMRAAGCEIVVDSKTIAVVGITEVIKHIPRIYREFFRMVSAARGRREELSRKFGVDISKHWIALLPGSRQKEVLLNLPMMLAAAARLGSAYEFLLPVASTLSRDWMKMQVERSSTPIHLVDDSR